MKSKWCIVLYALLFPALSQAGLLSDLHHIRGRMHERPVVAGTVAGAAGGRVVRTIIEHPLLVGVGAGAIGIGALYILHKDHCHITGDTYGVHMWTCHGVQGAHPWKQEAKDLVTLNSANAKILAKNLTKAGEPRPGKGCAAHHIVPSDAKYDVVFRARRILEHCQISINSYLNGVWLPQVKKGSACHGVYHPGDIHGKHKEDYYTWVFLRLNAALLGGNSDEESCSLVKETLQKIKTHLLEGSTPWVK